MRVSYVSQFVEIKSLELLKLHLKTNSYSLIEDIENLMFVKEN